MNRRGGKRNADAAFADAQAKPQSPYMPIFERFRDELDAHHDRRERVIKASRDITAASKKIIFSLQRIRRVGNSIPKEFHKQKEWDTISASYEAIKADLQGMNAYRYSGNVTGGNQELMEAMAFQHYLETQRLMSIEEARQKLTSLYAGDEQVMLTESDYVLGVFDMVGELMRFAITAMATGYQITAPGTAVGAMDTEVAAAPTRSVLSDLRELRSSLELVNVGGSSLARDYGKKMGVMQECVEKVERASYGQVVRGSERPKGWIPDLEDRREEVEAS